MSHNNQNEEPGSLTYDDSFLDIDPNKLDKNWIDQPKLAYKWSRKLANARNKLDEAKSALELARADAANDLRERPQKFALKKVTDKAVEAAIPKHPTFADALQDFNEAKHRVGLLEAAVTAIEHKKRALEKMVDLFTFDYFSVPRASEGSKEGMDQIEKRAIRSKGRNRSNDD